MRWNGEKPKPFPESLVKDPTVQGEISLNYGVKVVHPSSDERYMFIALENGNLRLCIDGTWKWSER